MKQLSLPRLLALSSFAFATTLVANTIDPAVFGHKVLQLAPDNPNTLLGFSTFAASMLGVVLGPIAGAWSDRSHSRLGPRMPFFLAGVPVLIIALLTIALAPSITIFVLGVLLFRLGDNLIFPPWQALYPDHVPASQRGVGAGVRSFMDIAAVLVGRFASGELLALSPTLGERATLLAVGIPIIGLLAALFFTRHVLNELPNGNEKAAIPRPSLASIFQIDWRQNKAFTWWFINRSFFWISFTILGTFLLFFIIDVIGLVESDAQRFLARFSLVLGGSVLLIALPSGRMADRWGRKPLVLAACAMTTVGTILIVLFRDLNAMTYAGALIGFGSGIFISADFALLTDIVPNDEAGRYLGISGIASAGGGAIARLLGGSLIDPINKSTGSSATGYIVLYSLAALLFFFSLLAALRLPNEKVKSRV